MKAMMLLGMALLLITARAEELRKTAVLFLPDQIECKSGSGARLLGEIGFRWDETEPLYLSLFQNPKATGSDQVFGAIQVYDEQGRELDKVLQVTLPPIPDKEIIINKNELKRFEIWELHSTTIFPRPGIYYATASFDYAVSAGKSVSFTTNKRWFKIVEASRKDAL